MVETIWTKLHRTRLRTPRRYLELSGVNALVPDLREKDIRTKIRLRVTGAPHGGIPFERGSLFYLLRNRFYIGEVKYKGEILPGQQPAIMETPISKLLILSHPNQLLSSALAPSILSNSSQARSRD